MTSELIEQVARAICVSDGAPIPEIRSWHKRYAQAAIAAMQADTSEQAAELAKFKALAETLATDLWECARALQSLHQIPGTGADGRLLQRIKEITDTAHAAVAQYKEARHD